MGQLDGKTALVTGATSGIGLASARALAAEGAYVFVTGRREELLEEIVSEVGADHVQAVRADVTDLDDLDRVMAAVESSGRGLDILFANAGIAGIAPLGQITWEDFTSTFSTNVGGIVFTVQKELPLLVSGSSVILCGSGLDTKASPGMGVYAASKAAIRSLTRTFAAELVERGIRVNAVGPGATRTEGLTRLMPDSEQLASQVPMRRIAEADEAAGVVVFLASERSSYMTGSQLYVDGGSSQL
ncbi:SDR family NAD(P)-dependent oxidoreductase [Streptomyces sp. NPDC058459]|uniref:SDR family NAD(P)-dependent oxidoreductase n=1 Tax=Streptomyces sp. NPDC058459 TaxID=3346508 RepID=UPI003650EB6F